MAVGKPLHLRLFLEGEEVPVIAAQVGINTNAPATASIQVVPLDEVLDLKPRTMVHLFFLDDYSIRAVATPDARNRNEEDKLNIPYLDNYKLLFAGEVVGFQFVQTPNSRAAVLQCLDFSSYWDAAHATALEYGPNGNAMTDMGSLSASDTGLFDDIVNTNAEQLVRWIRQKPITPGLTGVSGLAGGVIHMLEMMGGVSNHHKGVNDFFTIAELRCRLLAQISAEENDPTAANLLKATVFDQWLKNGLQNIGLQVSFRDMLKLLFGYIHYDVVPNPASKFDESVTGSTKTSTTRARMGEQPLGISAITSLKAIRDGLQQNIATEDLDALLRLAKDFTVLLKDVDATLVKLASKATKLAKSISQARASLSKAINALDSIKTKPKDSKFISPVVTAIQATIDIIDDPNGEKVVVSSSSTTTGTSQRLRAQIIRPDCFFSPPPRCNVIFPETYTQVSYDRLFLSEVTRSMVLSYNSLVGQDALFATRILAPSVGIDTKELTKAIGKSGYRNLMQHELHTGIIPRSEWLPDTAAAVGEKSVADDVKSSRLSWTKKIALFHFFKYRFGPRQVSVGGRFNPYLVCGFPALVITRPYIIPGVSMGDIGTDAKVVDLIQDKAKELGAPSQLVGMVTSLAHNIDQNGGSTSVSMTHSRKHLGVDDEFLGVFLKGQTKTKKRVKVLLRSKDVQTNPNLLNILVKVTPQVGDAIKSKVSKKQLSKKSVQTSKVTRDKTTGARQVQTATKDYETLGEAAATDTSSLAPLTANGHIDKLDRIAVVPNPSGALTTGGKGVYGTIIGIEVLDSNTQNFAAGRVYAAVAIYEEVEVSIDSSLPVEKIIRPQWFSEAYTNESIGEKIYGPFFGVSSIIDEATFNGLGSQQISTKIQPQPEGKDVNATDFDLTSLLKEMSDEENQKAKVSIEKAVNFLGYVYGLVKARNLDVDEFIRSYTNRPIATMRQILGDPDLDLSVDPSGSVTVLPVTTGGVTRTPRLGYHSLAIHPKVVNQGKLAGLLTEPDLHVNRIDGTGAKEPIPPQYDVRKEKKDRVLVYIQALQQGPGFRG